MKQFRADFMYKLDDKLIKMEAEFSWDKDDKTIPWIINSASKITYVSEAEVKHVVEQLSFNNGLAYKFTDFLIAIPMEDDGNLWP